jgi:hypothetical protein
VKGAAFVSISTWRQSMPSTMSAQPTRLVDGVADRIVSIGPGRLRVSGVGYYRNAPDFESAVRPEG